MVGASPGGVAEAGIEAAALRHHNLHHTKGLTSKLMATVPVGEDQSLKKAPPVTARPMEPRPVRVAEAPWGHSVGLRVARQDYVVGRRRETGGVTLEGSMGREMYCHRSQAVLGLVNTWSCSWGWSGTCAGGGGGGGGGWGSFDDGCG